MNLAKVLENLDAQAPSVGVLYPQNPGSPCVPVLALSDHVPNLVQIMGSLNPTMRDNF